MKYWQVERSSRSIAKIDFEMKTEKKIWPKMKNLPTKREKQILEFILSFWRRNLEAPIYIDLCKRFKMSKQGIYRHIENLRTKGLIQQEWSCGVAKDRTLKTTNMKTSYRNGKMFIFWE